jgi:hypothetical protein
MKFFVFLFSFFTCAALAANNLQYDDDNYDYEESEVYFVEEEETSWLKAQNLLNLIQMAITQIGELLADENLERLVFGTKTEATLSSLLNLLKVFPRKWSSKDQSNSNSSQVYSYKKRVALIRDGLKEV